MKQSLPLADLYELVTEYEMRFSPLLRGVEPQRAQEWVRAQLDLTQKRVVYGRRNGTVQGIGVLSPLPFDSEVFGFPMGRVDYVLARGTSLSSKRALLRQVISAAREMGLRHLVYRVSAQEIEAARAAQEEGFYIMPVFMGLACQVDRDSRLLHGPLGIRPGRHQDLAALRDLTRAAFSAGTRFHLDPVLPKEKGTFLHERWIENCCAGTAADAVIVAEREGQVAGFITCQKRRGSEELLGRGSGTIGLFAVAEPFRGRGVARALVDAALAWFVGQGVELVEVGTESTNFPALNCYVSRGFKIAYSAYSFHWSLRSHVS